MSTIRSKVLIIAEKQDFYNPVFFGMNGRISTLFAGLTETPEDISHFDLILLDCGHKMEKGLELLGEIKKCSPQSIVIFITDDNSVESTVKAFRLGARDFFRRPLNLNALKSAVNAFLLLKKSRHEKRSTVQVNVNESDFLRSVGLTWQEILQYIEANLENEIYIEDLASRAGLSKYYFIRSFKKIIGATPKEYITIKRIERAKELLEDNSLSITDVSVNVGFNDVSNFSNQFKVFTGDTPSIFRKKRQAENT